MAANCDGASTPCVSLRDYLDAISNGVTKDLASGRGFPQAEQPHRMWVRLCNSSRAISASVSECRRVVFQLGGTLGRVAFSRSDGEEAISACTILSTTLGKFSERVTGGAGQGGASGCCRWFVTPLFGGVASLSARREEGN
jgi:hypothetical protein